MTVLLSRFSGLVTLLSFLLGALASVAQTGAPPAQGQNQLALKGLSRPVRTFDIGGLK